MTTEHFTLHPTSVARARHFVAAELVDVDIELAELLITELATNALLHAHSDFTVTIDADLGHVTCAVADDSPVAPRLHVPAVDDIGGRGLFLVASLAARWGVERLDHGKRVWFQLPRAEPAT